MTFRRLLSDLASPHSLRRLKEVGALDPRFLLAGASVLPQLLRRGASLGILAEIHGRARPHGTAVIDRQGELTWSELNQRVDRLVNVLIERDVHPGQQVALLLRNGREFVETVLACQKLGAAAAPLNTWGKRPELGSILDRERPAALVYDVRHASQLDGVIPDGTAVLHVGDEGDALEGSHAYEDVLASASLEVQRQADGDGGSARIVIHTSGTTGTPKAAPRGTGGRGGAALLGVLDTVPYRHDDVMYVPNPLFHALGVLTFALGMITGATMVLPDGFDPDQAWRDLAEHDVTAASFVPVMVRRMLDVDDRPGSHLEGLRIVLVSGAAMPPELRRRVAETFGPVLYDLYGSTEAGWVAIATPETLRDAPEAVGRTVAGVEVAILDEDGEPVDEGEIHVRSLSTFEGYSSGEDDPRRAGYLSTGDLGYLDEHGYLHVVGRADDMAVVGGENVYPDEIEAVITDIDGVADCAVVGVDDEEMGEVLVAYVVGAVDEATVQEVCADQLASYKVPARVHLVDDLPRTSTGKIIRSELREREPEPH